MKNALTIDLEDYYQVTVFADHVHPDTWSSRESRLERNAEKMLELLDDAGVRATFFVIGWVGEKYAPLVRRIAECGHEIACHSHRHRLVCHLTAAEFREDSLAAKKTLEEATGREVLGYRAPSFSIPRAADWAFKILADLGFRYDSSIFPVDHPNYGLPHAPRFPFRIETSSGTIVEFPLPTVEFAGKRSPFGGGAYLRLLPYWFTRWAIRYLNESERHAVCAYLHPWELDPEQPWMHGHLSSQLRHYVGLRTTERKLGRLLREFSFAPLGALIEELEPLCPLQPR